MSSTTVNQNAWNRGAELVDDVRRFIKESGLHFSFKAEIPDTIKFLVSDFLLSDPIAKSMLESSNMSAKDLKTLIARFEAGLSRKLKAEDVGEQNSDISSNLRIYAYRILAIEYLSNIVQTNTTGPHRWILPTVRKGALAHALMQDPEIKTTPGLLVIVPAIAVLFHDGARDYILKVKASAEEVWSQPDFQIFKDMPEAIYRLHMTTANELKGALKQAADVHSSILNSTDDFKLFRETPSLNYSALRIAVIYRDEEKFKTRLLNSLKKFAHTRATYNFDLISDQEILQIDLDHPQVAIPRLRALQEERAK